jgi:hypothetical protein
MQMKSRAPPTLKAARWRRAGSKKHREGGPAHLACSHRKGAMMDRSEPGCVTVDWHVVRRVGKDHRGLLLAHQDAEGREVEHVTAQHPVIVEQPQIAKPADRRPGRNLGHGIGRVIVLDRCVVQRGDPQIDLAHLKTGKLEAEIQTLQGEVLELLGQQPVVPGGDLGQPVVGDHEGAGLGRGQVIEAEGRYLREVEFAGSEQATMPGDDLARAIDQDRDIEAEDPDAFGNLPDLLLAVAPRVGRIRGELVNRSVDDQHLRRRAQCLAARRTNVLH